MDPSRLLMFDPDVYVGLFGRYHDAVWPAPLVAAVLIAALFVLVFRPRPGGDRVIAGILGGFWIWTGAVFHFGYFSAINIAAPLYAALFVIQGGLLIWTGALKGGLRFRAERLAHCGRDFGLAVAALAVPPLTTIALGGRWLDGPLAGLTPDATLVLTLGLLGLAEGPTPGRLLVIPVIWCAIAALTAWLVAVPQLWILPVAAWIGLVARLR